MSLAIQCGACGATFKMPEQLWKQRVAGRVATLQCRKCRGPIRLDGTAAGTQTPSESQGPVPRTRPKTRSDLARADEPVARPAQNKAAGSQTIPRLATPPRPAHDAKLVKSRVASTVPRAQSSELTSRTKSAPQVPGGKATKSAPQLPGGKAMPSVAVAVKPSARKLVPLAKPVSFTQAIRETGSGSGDSKSGAPRLLGADVLSKSAQPPEKLATDPALIAQKKSVLVHDAAQARIMQGPSNLAKIDSTPSLRGLSLSSCAGDELDDGPTPPPVARSRRISKSEPEGDSSRRPRSFSLRGALSTMAVAAVVLLGGAFLWKARTSGSEWWQASRSLLEPPEQASQIADERSAVEPSVPTDSSATHSAAQARAPLVESAAASNLASPSPPSAATKTGGTPDERRLVFARTWARSHALMCHRGGRAVGDVTLTITFAPSGRVSQVEMHGEPVASAPVGRCIEDYYRSMLIPAFEGEPYTFSEQLTLR